MLKHAIAGSLFLAVFFGSQTTAQQDSRDAQDAARIRWVIESIGFFADLRQFQLICQLYDDISRVDYSSLWGNEPWSGSPSELATGWAGFIPGFDTTRHDISVNEISIRGDNATAHADVVADHWLDQRIWTLSGSYDVALVRKDDRWLISGWTFTFKDEVGDRGLVDEAEVIAANRVERPVRCQ